MIPYFVFDYFYIGPLRFNVWGSFVGLAFVAGYFLTLYRAKKKNIPSQKIFWLTLAIFFGSLVGSRVGYLLQFPNEWLADISLLWRFGQGGLMLWGGILGGISGGWIYIKLDSFIAPPLLNKERVGVRFSFWTLADLVTPAIALGIGIGRLGCFLINDHVGAPTNLPWGILWPDGVARQPVALYEMLVGFGLFFTLCFLQKELNRRRRFEAAAPIDISVIPACASPMASARRAKAGIQNSWIPPYQVRGKLSQARDDRSGQLFLLFLVSYSILRFLLDFLRASQGILADPRWWGLTTSQWISVLILLICSFYGYLIIRKSSANIF